MTTFLSVLVFIAIGAGGGYLMARQYSETSLLANVMVGIGGSLVLSWLMKLIGVGLGFTAFSFWGIVFGIAGALLAPWLYCLIVGKNQEKAASKSA